MVDSNNPLDQDFIDDISKAKSDVLGNALTQPKLFIIGRLNADGSVSTVVTDGEFGRVWVRQPGDDTGDAVEAINMGLEPHEVSRNRPVMVKKESGGLVITGKAIESANYDAQIPASPQRAINRDQYRVALITPSTPETSFYAYYRGGMFQLNNVAYRITDIPSGDFSGTVPGANAISIKVELDPTTGTWHETTGGAFTFSSMEAAFKNGDLDTARTFGRYLIGWIRLYAGQTAIELDDIFMAEHMLDLIDDHAAMNNLGADDHIQYVHIFPGSDIRNVIQPTAGDFRPLTVLNQAGATGLVIDKTAFVGVGGVPTKKFHIQHAYTGASGLMTSKLISTWTPTTSAGGEYPTGVNIEVIHAGAHTPASGYITGQWIQIQSSGSTAFDQRGLEMQMYNDDSGDISEVRYISLLTPSPSGTATYLSTVGLYFEDFIAGTVSNYPIYTNAGNIIFNAGNHATSNVTIGGTKVSAHYDLGLVGDGVLMQKETTTPTADTDYGKTYPKADNKLYFQDGAGIERELIRGQISTEAEADMLVWDAVNGTWINVPILKDKKELIGFAEGSRVKATLSFDNTTRTLTVSYISDYNIYDDSVMYPITGDLTRQISDDEGQHYIYYQNGALTSIYAPSAAERLDLFSILALTAVVYWDKTNQKINYLGEERHGTNIPGSVHKESHFTQGTWYYDNGGLGFSNFDIDGSGNDDSNVHFSVANGTVYDEDIEHNISNANQTLSPIAEMPIYYLDGTDWRRFWIDTAWQDAHVYSLGDQIRGDDSYFEVTTAGTSGGVEPTWAGNTEPGDPVVDNTVTWTCIGSPRANVRNFVGGSYRLAYNQLVGASWQQTEVNNGSFVLAHVMATNNLLDNQLMVVIQGQAQYSTIIAAREGAANEVNELQTAGLSFAEYVFIGTVIYQTSNGYGNEGKGRIRTTDTGADYVDFRFSSISSGGGTVSDHNVLGGLELAGPGVTYGHVDDQAQTIAGAKTFSSSVDISSGAFSLPTGTTVNEIVTAVSGASTDDQLATAKAVFDVSGGGGGNLEFVEEKTFAIAATTTSFLALTGTDRYQIECRFQNDNVNTTLYEFRINGDVNSNDYFYQQVAGSGSTPSAQLVTNQATLFSAFGSDPMFGTADIALVDGRLIATAFYGLWNATDAGAWVSRMVVKNTAGVSSITSIEVIASQTGALGVGTILRLYKVTT